MTRRSPGLLAGALMFLVGCEMVCSDSGPQYRPSLGFDTFSFLERLTPNIPAADYANDTSAQGIAPWLDNAHRELDVGVAAAYGWND